MKKKPSDVPFMGILIASPASLGGSTQITPRPTARASRLRTMIREAIQNMLANGLHMKTVIDSLRYTGARIVRTMQNAATITFEIIVYSHKRVGKSLVSRLKTIRSEVPAILPMSV